MIINQRIIFSGFFGFIALLYVIGLLFSFEPDTIPYQPTTQHTAIPGYATTTALINTMETLLNKPGGYLSNDVLPPMSLLDDIPAWEYGVLEMSRDLALVMRKDFSRSQSQSVENELLKLAQPQLNIDHQSWYWPSAESEYQQAIDALTLYRTYLANPAQQQAQFYTRTDNLRVWLKEMEKRLGSLSQRLSASVGQQRLNTDLAGDTSAQQSTNSASNVYLKTSWWQIDDTFYESRGACWALIHFLNAIKYDFADVLEKKNAAVSLQQIIRELEASQQPVWSPMILNGGGFGFLANHSLVMANYISRANAAIIELNDLLAQG